MVVETMNQEDHNNLIALEIALALIFPQIHEHRQNPGVHDALMEIYEKLKKERDALIYLREQEQELKSQR